MDILEVSGLSISYGSVNAVKNLDFRVEEHACFCIVGSNGAGKSSVVKGILGLAPVTSGQVHCPIPLEAVGYVPQAATISPDFPATVAEIVKTGTQKKGSRLPLYTRQDSQMAIEAMALFHIGDLAAKKISQLSGGQLQRVLLARAMAKKPKLLILDEPCAGLDEQLISEFYQLISTLNKSNQITIIMVSHDLDEVERHATHVLQLGRKEHFYGAKQDWITRFRKGGGR